MKKIIFFLLLTSNAYSICYNSNGEEVYAMCEINENFVNKLENFNVTSASPSFSRIIRRGTKLNFRISAVHHPKKKFVLFSNYFLDGNTGFSNGQSVRLSSGRSKKRIESTGYADDGTRISLAVKCQYTCID